MFERKHIPSMIAALATVSLLSACNQHRNGPGSSPANAAEAIEQAAGQMAPTSDAVGYEKVEDAQASVESVSTKSGDHEDMTVESANLAQEAPQLANALEDLKTVTDATIRKGNSQDAEKVPMELVLKEHDKNIATVRFVQGDQKSSPEIVEQRGDFPLESVQLNAVQDPSTQEESYESAVLTFRQTVQPEEQGQFIADQQQAQPEDKVVKVTVRLTPVQEEQAQQEPQAESKQAPQAESKQAPQAESKQAPQAESKQAPQAESKQAPQAESKQAPQAESKQAPQAETKEQSNIFSQPQQPQAESRSEQNRPEEHKSLGQRISDRVGSIFGRRR